MRKLPIDECVALFHDTLHSESENPPRLRSEPFMEELVRGTVARHEQVDEIIKRHLQHWRLERMAAVDRNILRLAVYEMISTDTPPAVVIDEALELARRFSTDESVQFVNGVLDAAHRDIGNLNATAGQQ